MSERPRDDVRDEWASRLGDELREAFKDGWDARVTWECLVMAAEEVS